MLTSTLKTKGLILLMLISMTYATFTRIEENTWEEKQYNLPDFMRVTGTASGYLPAEQVVIEFDIETLSDSAGTSLQQNNHIISKAINLMKSSGIEEKELSTQNLKIYPSYKSQYNESTKNYDSIFEGYKVENKLRFISKKIESAGKVIDVAVSNGINKVSSVTIGPTASKIKELKDSLIAVAVEDATTRAKLALVPLGYEIKAVKSIELDSYNNNNGGNLYKSRAYFLSLDQEDQQSSGETQLFENSEKYAISVNVSFIIGKAI